MPITASFGGIRVLGRRRSQRGTASGVRERRQVWKRVLDLVLALALLVLLLPLLVILAIAIKLDSAGPVLYRAPRVGLYGAEFTMLKFRKMHLHARGPALTIVGDPRFTRLGRFLASSKLDELPQLWNVLRGEMSVVGPRPEDPSLAALASARFEGVLDVKPGITGLSQLAFAREGELIEPVDRVNDYLHRLLPQKLALERIYAERRSLALDLRILAWTVVAILLRREIAVRRSDGRLRTRHRPLQDQAGQVALARARRRDR